jgi:hypothetical protein
MSILVRPILWVAPVHLRAVFFLFPCERLYVAFFRAGSSDNRILLAPFRYLRRYAQRNVDKSILCFKIVMSTSADILHASDMASSLLQATAL